MTCLCRAMQALAQALSVTIDAFFHVRLKTVLS